MGRGLGPVRGWVRSGVRFGFDGARAGPCKLESWAGLNCAQMSEWAGCLPGLRGSRRIGAQPMVKVWPVMRAITPPCGLTCGLGTSHRDEWGVGKERGGRENGGTTDRGVGDRPGRKRES